MEDVWKQKSQKADCNTPDLPTALPNHVYLTSVTVVTEFISPNDTTLGLWDNAIYVDLS